MLSGPDGGLEAGRGAGLGDDAERGPACLGVHAVDGDPEFVGEIVTDGGIGPCVGLAAQRGQERGGVAHRGRRIPVHARQSGTGASVLGADRHVERAQTHVESPAAPRGAGEVVVAVDLHTPVLVGLPHLPTDRVVRLGGKRLHIHLLTGEQAADRRALAVMRLLGHRVATLQHVPGQLAVGLCVGHGHHDVAAQEPDRVLHAALLIARVRVAEPGLQPVMLHEQFEHVHDGDLVPRDPMAGAGGVVKHQRQGDRAYVLEHRAQPRAHAFGVLPGQGHAVAHVRIRERDDQAMHVDPVPADHGLRHAEIDLRLARMPLELQIPVRREAMLLAPPFHVPPHRRIRALVALLRHESVVHALGGVPLLAGHEPVRLQPPVHRRPERIELRRPRYGALRSGRAILPPGVLRDRVAGHAHLFRDAPP